MCTLTWLVEEDGFSVFFNRDERRSRASALAPYYSQEHDAIMPLDPQGGGTWIAAHNSGLVLCLLNFYKYQIESNETRSFVSRGSIIPELITAAGPEGIAKGLEKFDLNQYQAFRLCVFPADFGKLGGAAEMYLWDGHRLQKRRPTQPVISSAINTAKVKSSRYALFEQMAAGEKADTRTHLCFHSSHLPEKGGLSVCMHRPDAKTQSLSHIRVGKGVSFSYLAGSPCTQDAWLVTEML